MTIQYSLAPQRQDQRAFFNRRIDERLRDLEGRIEANKRAIAGHLLQKVAAVLKIDVGELDGAAERRLLENLQEAS